MTTFLIWNEKNSIRYERSFLDYTEARHWVINHLDLSLNWVIEHGKNEQYQMHGYINTL